MVDKSFKFFASINKNVYLEEDLALGYNYIMFLDFCDLS